MRLEQVFLEYFGLPTSVLRPLWCSAPQGSPRTPAICIAATTPELIVGILNSVFFKFF